MIVRRSFSLMFTDDGLVVTITGSAIKNNLNDQSGYMAIEYGLYNRQSLVILR